MTPIDKPSEQIAIQYENIVTQLQFVVHTPNGHINLQSINTDVFTNDHHVKEIQVTTIPFKRATIKLLAPIKCTLFIYATGTCIILGINDAKLQRNSFRTILHEIITIVHSLLVKSQPTDEEEMCIPKITYTDPKIVNIISSFRFQEDVNINLDRGVVTLENTYYEPCVFPGLIHRNSDGKSVLTYLIFTNGRIICLGSNEYDRKATHMKQMIEKLYHSKLIERPSVVHTQQLSKISDVKSMLNSLTQNLTIN